MATTATEIIAALTEAVTLESQKLAEQLTPVFAATELMDQIMGNRVTKFGTGFQVKFPLELTLPGTIKYSSATAGNLAGDNAVLRPAPSNIETGIALEDMPLGYSAQVTVNLTKYVGSIPVLGHHLVIGDILRTVSNLTVNVFGRAAELVARADATAILAEAPNDTPGVLASVSIAEGAGNEKTINAGGEIKLTFTEGASDFSIASTGNIARLVPNERYWLYKDDALTNAPSLTGGDTWDHEVMKVWVKDRKIAKAGEQKLTIVIHNGNSSNVTLDDNQTLYFTVPGNSSTTKLFPIGLEELADDDGYLFRDSNISREDWGAVLSSPVYDPGSTTVPTAAVLDNALRLVEATVGKLTGDWLLISSPGVYLSHVRSEEVREYKLRPARTIEGGHTGFEYAYTGGVLTWVTEPMFKSGTIIGMRKGAVKKLIPPVADRVQFWANVFGYNTPYIMAYAEGSSSGYSTKPMFAATVPFHVFRQFIGWPRDFFRIDNMAEQSY